MKDELAEWLHDKEALGAVFDLRAADSTRPVYMPYTPLELWRSLQRFVVSTGREGTKRSEALDLVAQTRSRSRVSMAPYVYEHDEPEDVPEADDTYYTGSRPPRTVNLDMSKAGDEQLAFQCIQNYQRALSCYQRRRENRSSTFVPQCIALSAISKLLRGKGRRKRLTKMGGVPIDDLANSCVRKEERKAVRFHVEEVRKRRAAKVWDVCLDGSTLDTSHAPAYAVAAPAWVEAGLPCRRVEVWKLCYCALQHTAAVLDSASVLSRFTSLAFLDLSNNELTQVPPGLVSLPLLSVLYLHMNQINSVADLAPLEGLAVTSLTLHGNRITKPPKENGKLCLQDKRGYRPCVLRYLTRLRNLDHTAVTTRERELL